MSGALVAHALPGFWPLLASRFVFGLGFGTVWTAGIAWITELAPPERRAEVLARPMTIAGVAFMCGPVIAGVVAQDLGVRTPFVASGVIGVVVGVFLLRVPEPVVRAPPRHAAACARRCAAPRPSRRSSAAWASS